MMVAILLVCWAGRMAARTEEAVAARNPGSGIVAVLLGSYY
jgi:hypothetical protein